MKTQTLKTIIASVALALAVALPAIVHAKQSSSSSGKTTVAASDSTVSGKVTEKTTDEITVAGQAIAVNSATSITKAGEKIKLEDLKVGDKVSVVTVKSEEGKLLAVTVEVLSMS